MQGLASLVNWDLDFLNLGNPSIYHEGTKKRNFDAKELLITVLFHEQIRRINAF